MLAQFTRTNILLGEDNLTKLAGKHILIAGVGGVGGYVAEVIARAGVGKITLIDNDVVDITNLNRQLISTLANVGELKVNEFAKRILAINPEVQLMTQAIFIDADNLADLLGDRHRHSLTKMAVPCFFPVQFRSIPFTPHTYT